MVSDASVRWLQAPHVLLFPAAALSITVLAFIMVGDAVRDALDPSCAEEGRTLTTISKTSNVPAPRSAPEGTPLLEVRDLHVEFHTRDGVAKAVNGVSYSVNAGETLAVLGESGSGKSVTAQAIMGILDMPPGKIPHGEILFQGQDLLKLPAEDFRKIRGQKIAMIFQDALSR